MKKTDDLLTTKLMRYFKVCMIEQSVYVQILQGNITLKLMTQEIIEKFLEEIPSKHRNLIKYVHLQGVQIAIKSMFQRMS